MATELIQHPTDQYSYYDCAYTRLPYMVSGSTDVGQPQFRYVMDIFESGSGDLIHRTTQPVNPAGVGVFDPSRVIQGQLNYSEDFNVQGFKRDQTSSNNFDIKFTTQYGTSDSSSISVQAYEVSHSIGIFSATRDLNLQSNVNLIGDYLDVYNTGWAFPGIHFEATVRPEWFIDSVLTNNPYLMSFERRTIRDNTPGQPLNPIDYPQYSAPLVSYGDYMSVSYLRYGTVGGNPMFTPTVYSGSTVVNSGSNFFSGVTHPFGTVLTAGVGPQNLIDVNPSTFGFLSQSNNWTHIETDFNFGYGQETTLYLANEEAYKDGTLPQNVPGPNASSSLQLYTEPYNICDDKVRFAFINNFGVYDYYTIYNPVRKISDLKRESVNLSQFNYSNKQPNVPTIPGQSPYERVFESSNRGQKDFYIDRQDRFIITTDHLQQPVAQWLEELMESPRVYIQESTGFIPIVITNTRVTYNNKQARNKLFQYTIEFKYANKRLGNTTSPLGQS